MLGSTNENNSTRSRTFAQVMDQTKGLSPPSTLPSLEHVVGNIIRGLLLLTEQREILYSNAYANRALKLFSQSPNERDLIPLEIWHICNFLIEGRKLFPHQLWIHESKIFIDSSRSVLVQARWLSLETLQDPCLCLVMEDENQFIQEVAIEEAYRYGLTTREAQVWILHRMRYTYKDIARELEITANTVKKHMKSILTKKKQAE
ncbi:MAG: LuxR C-terminal-related transcriptional regulator [Cyanobacteria bacterium P01_D01_bin.44]